MNDFVNIFLLFLLLFNNKLEKANSDNFEFIFEDFMNLNNFPSIIQCWIT